jgi:hypothetical protein
MVKEDGLAIADALREIWQALESEGFSAFNRSDPDDRHAAADRALEVSLARLSSEEQERFLQLAVFPDADVPLAVLERFWGSGRFEMQRFCCRLHDLSLLLRFNRQEGTVRLARPFRCLPEDLGKRPRSCLPDQRYVSFGLAGCLAAEYLARPEPLAWALAALMDPGDLSRAELKMACLRRVAKLRGRFDSFLLVNCIENYLELTDEEAVEFATLRARKENRRVQAMKLTWSEELEAKGEARGEAKGETKGVREILLLLLAERFGPLPEGARRQVEEISSLQRLTQLAKRVLTAHSLEEMGLA